MFQYGNDFCQIIEVGPRDGLQNEKQLVSSLDKIEFINKLYAAGVSALELTSFVSPKAIPQMADAQEVAQKIIPAHANKRNIALIPNMKGYEAAKDNSVTEIAVFSATSDAFNQKNIKTDVEGSFERLDPVIKAAKKDNIKVRAYISTAYGCPYQGEKSNNDLIKVIERFAKYDVSEISIGDTIGVATPKQVDKSLAEIVKIYDVKKLAMHFHDTRGMALSNILVSLEHGIRAFDSSAGGLGGCPYAKGATGNVATEDVLYLLHSLGLKTGIDFEKLSEASLFMLNKINRNTESKYLRAYLNSKK